MHNCRPMKYLTRIRFLNQLYMHYHPDCIQFYLENFRHRNKIMETHRLNRIPIESTVTRQTIIVIPSRTDGGERVHGTHK